MKIVDFHTKNGCRNESSVKLQVSARPTKNNIYVTSKLLCQSITDKAETMTIPENNETDLPFVNMTCTCKADEAFYYQNSRMRRVSL